MKNKLFKTSIFIVMCSQFLHSTSNEMIQKETNFLDKGILHTFQEMKISGTIENLKIESSDRLITFNKRFASVFMLDVKPFEYYKSLNANISAEKFRLIKETANESGRYLIATKAFEIPNLGSESYKDELRDSVKGKIKNIIGLRYLFILKNYKESAIKSILEEYKSNSYQAILKKTLSKISLKKSEQKKELSDIYKKKDNINVRIL